MPDAAPVALLDVTRGALSVGLDACVEEWLENGNGAEEKPGPEVGTAVFEDIVPDGPTTLKVGRAVDVAFGRENMAGIEVS